MRLLRLGSDEEGEGQEGEGEEGWKGAGEEDNSSGSNGHEEGAGDEGELPTPPPIPTAEVAMGWQLQTCEGAGTPPRSWE